MSIVPVVVLSNGLRIANFSSPHPFVFEDGTTLAACSAERANALKLESREQPYVRDGWTDIALEFAMSDSVGEAIAALREVEADIVLVPLPVLQAARHDANLPAEQVQRLRVCRVKDRVTKTVCIDRFCI